MPRKQDEVRIFQIGEFWLTKRANSSSWYRSWLDEGARQTRRVSLGTDDLEQAKRALATWVISNGDMRAEKPADVPLATCLARYYEHQAKKLRSADQARHALLKWNGYFGPTLVSEVTPERQRAFVKSMEGEGCSEGYIRRTLAVGKAALNRALREGEITSAPFVALPSESEPRDRIMTVQEMAALFRAADEPHLAMYLMLAVGTLARPEAIVQMDASQVDASRRLIRLNPKGRKQNKKRRPDVPIAETLASILVDLPAGPVVSYQGRALKSIRSGFDRLKERSGISDVSPYTIRHTMATELRGRGVAVWEVAGFLGHTSGYKTTERYAKFGPDHLGEAVRAIDAYFMDLGTELGALVPDLFRDLVACQLRATPS